MAEAYAPTRVWLRELRLPFLTLSTVLVVLGAVAGWALGGRFDPLLFLLTLGGIGFIHLGTNVVNDYFDYLGGTDNVNRTPTPFSGGSRVIQEKLLPPREVYRGALVFFSIGSAMGLLLAYLRGWPVLALGLLGVGLAFSYTYPRVNLAGRGLGEFAVGLGFGPLIVGGSYYVQTQRFDPAAWLAGAVMGLLVAAVLWVNQFPDVEADGATGKRNLVVRLGRERASRVYLGLVASAFALTLLGALLRILPLWALLPLAASPLGFKAASIARHHPNEIPRLIPASASTVLLSLLYGGLLALSFALTRVLP
ncbi:MAG: 1,4-dihydroxy-2-naphthoate octaprenyltransferase [Euryarchaeota archaeon]|nr:1,4-dihydroxy-2-naphthoate octaprenyltransferase [Euryarchaeota archaeon]